MTLILKKDLDKYTLSRGEEVHGILEAWIKGESIQFYYRDESMLIASRIYEYLTHHLDLELLDSEVEIVGDRSTCGRVVDIVARDGDKPVLIEVKSRFGKYDQASECSELSNGAHVQIYDMLSHYPGVDGIKFERMGLSINCPDTIIGMIVVGTINDCYSKRICNTIGSMNYFNPDYY